MPPIFDKLWIHANLATFADGSPSLGCVHDGAVASTDGMISWLGRRAELPGPPEQLSGNVIDCGNQWILPGFVDCHTHLVFAGNRIAEFQMRHQGVSYAEIAKRGLGIVSTVRETRNASEEQLFDAAANRVWQLIRDGVTTVEIKSGYGLTTESEAKMLRVARRLGRELPISVRTTFLGAHVVPKEYLTNRSAYVNLVCEEMLPGLAEQNLIDSVDAFCETIAFSPAEVERVFSAARSLNLPVKLHAEQLSNSGGAALAARFGALSADHLEYLDESGVAELAENSTVAVLLPGAYFVLNETRVPPLALLRQYNVPIAIATDCNPGSSPILSIRLAASMGCQLFGLSTEEALRGITSNAARALGISQTTGSLELGKHADFVICDISEPAEALYWLGGNLVKTVVRQGHTIPLQDIANGLLSCR